jgi:hypothetical protein
VLHSSRPSGDLCHGSGLYSTILVRPRAFDTRAFATRNVVQPPTCRYRSARPNLDYLRVADYTSNEVSRLLGFPGHRSTCAEQSMELENLKLD